MKIRLMGSPCSVLAVLELSGCHTGCQIMKRCTAHVPMGISVFPTSTLKLLTPIKKDCCRHSLFQTTITHKKKAETWRNVISAVLRCIHPMKLNIMRGQIGHYHAGNQKPKVGLIGRWTRKKATHLRGVGVLGYRRKERWCARHRR